MQHILGSLQQMKSDMQKAILKKPQILDKFFPKCGMSNYSISLFNDEYNENLGKHFFAL